MCVRDGCGCDCVVDDGDDGGMMIDVCEVGDDGIVFVVGGVG